MKNKKIIINILLVGGIVITAISIFAQYIDSNKQQVGKSVANFNSVAQEQVQEIHQQQAGFQSISINKEDPYIVEIEVKDESTGEREHGFAKALNQVVTNVVDSKSKDTPTQETRKILANPSNYVQRYTYVTRNLSPEKQSLFLQIYFDQNAILKILQPTTNVLMLDKGENPSFITNQIDRKQILILVGSDLGGNKIIENQTSNDVITHAFKQSDMGVVFPSLGFIQTGMIKPEDVYKLDVEKIKLAAKAHGAANVIAGFIKKPVILNTPWSVQLLFINDNNADILNFSGTTAENLITQIMDFVSAEKKLILKISSVNGLEQYNEIVRYLHTFNSAMQITLTKISSNEVELCLEDLDKKSLIIWLSSQTRLVPSSDVITSKTKIDLNYKWVPNANEQQPQAVSIKPLS